MRARKAGWIFGAGMLVSGGAFAAGVCGLPPIPPPSPDLQAQVEALLHPSDASTGADLFTREEQYYRLVQKQLLRDAIVLFSSPAPETVYAEFNPDDGPPGLDLGYGLKVIKRVTVGDKTIFVNEAWPFQRGHFQLPSEIRIRTRMFYKPGDPEGQEGSEYQYLNGRYRVGWDRMDQAHFYEEPGYLKPSGATATGSARDGEGDGEPVRAQRRVRADIYNCMGCHLAGNPFTRLFVTGGGAGLSPAPIQYESIVQPGYFSVPVEQTHGFQQFMRYLAGQNAPSAEVSALRAALATPVASFHAADFRGSMVAALCEKLRNNRFDFLDADPPFTGDPDSLTPSARRDGIYEDGSALWRDSLDVILEGRFGKYIHWVENRGTVPRQ